jgi:hypothetical protein
LLICHPESKILRSKVPIPPFFSNPQYGDPPLHTTSRYNRIGIVTHLLSEPNYRTLWVERRKKKLANALEFEEEERRMMEARSVFT